MDARLEPVRRGVGRSGSRPRARTRARRSTAPAVTVPLRALRSTGSARSGRVATFRPRDPSPDVPDTWFDELCERGRLQPQGAAGSKEGRDVALALTLSGTGHCRLTPTTRCGAVWRERLAVCPRGGARARSRDDGRACAIARPFFPSGALVNRERVVRTYPRSAAGERDHFAANEQGGVWRMCVVRTCVRGNGPREPYAPAVRRRGGARAERAAAPGDGAAIPQQSPLTTVRRGPLEGPRDHPPGSMPLTIAPRSSPPV